MKSLIRSYGWYVGASVVGHMVLLGLLFFHWESSESNKPLKVENIEIVKAISVDKTRVEAAIRRQQLAEQTRKNEEEQRVRALQQKERDAKLAVERAKKQRAQEEAQRVAELRKKEQDLAVLKKQEQQKQARLKQLELDEKKRQAELAAQRKKEAEAKAREQAEEKKRQEQERINREKEQQRLAEEKRQREAEIAALKKKQEEEQKRKEQLERERAETERKRALEKAMAEEELNRRVGEAVVSFNQAFRARFERNFNKSNLPLGLQATLEFRMDLTGRLLSARVSRSSGNQRFDNEVLRALERSAPLPIPTDPEVAKRFAAETFEHTHTNR